MAPALTAPVSSGSHPIVPCARVKDLGPNRFWLFDGEMTKLHHKVKNALDEARTLILGAQVLLGFAFRGFFEPGFESLSLTAKYLKVAGLGCLLLAIILMFMPAAFHRIVEYGQDSERLHRFVTSVICWALLPFALGFGIDCFVVGEKAVDRTWSIVAGGAILLLALFFWYGLEALAKKLEFGGTEMKRNETEQQLNVKIEQVLTEIRMVLPGVQALLGFQMASTMTQAFEKLPESSKQVHFSALLLIALSVIFLMTPSAYHRIVEGGEDTERFHTFASRMLIAAMIPLPVGIAAEVFVVLRKFSQSIEWPAAAAAVTMLLAWLLWFGITSLKRAKDHRQHAQELHAPA